MKKYQHILVNQYKWEWLLLLGYFQGTCFTVIYQFWSSDFSGHRWHLRLSDRVADWGSDGGVERCMKQIEHGEKKKNMKWPRFSQWFFAYLWYLFVFLVEHFVESSMFFSCFFCFLLVEFIIGIFVRVFPSSAMVQFCSGIKSKFKDCLVRPLRTSPSTSWMDEHAIFWMTSVWILFI